MNLKTLIATVSLTIAAAPAFAAGTMTDAPKLMSRIEVRAAMTADADNYLNRGEAYGTVIPVSTLSRETVLAELQAAREAGLIVAGSETYGLFRHSDFASTRSRDEVRAEAQGGGLSRGERIYSGA